MFRVAFQTPRSELNIVVLSELQDLYDYACQYLPPDWIKTDGAENSIEIYVSEKSDTYFRSIVASMRNSEHVGFVKTFEGNGYYYLEDGSIKTLLCIDESHFIKCFFETRPFMPDKIEIGFCNPFIHLAPKIMLRVIRDLMQKYCHMDKGIMLHGSSIYKNGCSVIFLADKGSGKTSWMLKMLKLGWQFMGNDRLFLFLGKGEEGAKIVPFPIAAMLSRENLLNLPPTLRLDLLNNKVQRQDFKEDVYQKYGLTPFEITRAFGCNYHSQGKLKGIVLLEPNKLPPRISIEKITNYPDDSVLKNNIYTPKDPAYTFNWITRPFKKQISKEQIVKNIKKDISFYKIKFGWDCFDQERDRDFDFDF